MGECLMMRLAGAGGIDPAKLTMLKDPVSLISDRPTGSANEGVPIATSCAYGNGTVTLTSNSSRTWDFTFDLSSAPMDHLFFVAGERISQKNYGAVYFVQENMLLSRNSISSPTESFPIGSYSYNPTTKILKFTGYDGSSYTEINGFYPA